MSALRKVMDLLARRDHSEKELRKKLKERFSEEEIEKAVGQARDRGWLGDENVLADRAAQFLHRRHKGIRAINHQLRERGLPSVAADPEQELEKALHLAETKLKGAPPTRELKAKIARFLLSRGFDSEIVRKVVYEKL